MLLSSDPSLEPGLDQRIAQAIERHRPGLRDQVDAGAIDAMAEYTRELSRWNAVHNLTAIESVDEVIRRHLIDTMGAWPGLRRFLYVYASNNLLGQQTGTSPQTASPFQAPPYVVDVGSGNGVPGLVLAILEPSLRIYLIEKSSRKAAFLRHAAATLGLSGRVFVVSADVAQVQLDERDGCAIILSRAFAALEDFLDRSWHLSQQQTHWLYMAGRRDQVLGLAQIQGSWRYDHPRRPGDFCLESLETDFALEAERHLVWIRRRAS